MKKKTRSLILAVAVICFLGSAAFADVPTTTGTISKVTVYRGQALVTRTVKVDLPAGTSELIVTDLPARIVPESLYAQTSGKIKVLSVRYREKAVKEDTREEVKRLDAQIEKTKSQLYHAERDLQHSQQAWKRYQGLWKLTIDGANANLNRGLLESKPIEQLTKYLESKSIEWHKENVRLEDSIKNLKKELELLNRKRAELDAGRARTEREAVLFISSEGGKKASIGLNYLVNGANWLAAYNLRANPEKSNVLIEYNAVVNQTSGEDWDGVALSLSTAEPTMVSAPPVLEPMSVRLGRARKVAKMVSGVAVQEADQVRLGFIDRSRQFQDLFRSRREQARKGKAAQVELGQIAASRQILVFNAPVRELAGMKQQVIKIARTEGVSVTYELPGKLTLPSRTDQQLVTIATITAGADFTLLATPLLTDYVYLQAELLNDSDTILLAGQASMFRNGEFVGKSQLPIVTIGEKFTAGFGIDSQVQVARELEDKKTRIQGGNRIDTYHYRIALSNYKKTEVKLRLLDRLPYTDDDSIKIELQEEKTEPELSKDSEYLRTARKKGILRWDLNLVPNTVDEDATIVKYSFTMEYDKNMQIQPRR